MRIGIALVTAAVVATSLPAASDPHSGVYRGHPVAMSPDGQWLLSVNAQRQLLRQSVTAPNRIERVGLPGPVRAIATSHSAKRVAVALANGKLGVVSFALRNSPGGALLWKISPGDSHLLDDSSLTCLGESRPSTGRITYLQTSTSRHAVAVSSDGRLVAVNANPIAIYWGDSGELIQCIPTGDAGADDIRFVDHDTKLLVVQASGKGRSLYSTWDVRNGELLNLHAIPRSNTRGIETARLRNVDHSGRMIVPDSDTGPEKRLSLWKRVDLRTCGSTTVSVPDPNGLDNVPNIDLLVDPRGRWIARVTSTGDVDQQRANSRVEFLNTDDGTVLGEVKVDAGDPLILSNGDGSKLLGIASPPPRLQAAGGFRIGDGPLRAFPIDSPPTTGEAADVSATWPRLPCMIEDEVAQARSVRGIARHAVRQFIVPIDDAVSWHQTPGGPLWIDTGNEIEKHDPQTGRLLDRVAKPKFAVTPWYAREEFLGWQGDTVTRRPFADPTDRKRRIVVATRPGWIALGARPVGEHVEVRWATPACAKKTQCNEGDESTAHYDDQGTEIPKASFGSPRQAEGLYTWSRSYFGSIRARLREPDNTEKTVMWIGLRASQWGGPETAPEDSHVSDDSVDPDDSTQRRRLDWRHPLIPWQSSSVLPFDGPIGVLFNRSGVWVYDAEARALLAHITEEHTSNVVWNPDTRIIVVESHDTENDIHLLRGYLIEAAPTSSMRHSGAQNP